MRVWKWSRRDKDQAGCRDERHGGQRVPCLFRKRTYRLWLLTIDQADLPRYTRRHVTAAVSSNGWRNSLTRINSTNSARRKGVVAPRSPNGCRENGHATRPPSGRPSQQSLRARSIGDRYRSATSAASPDPRLIGNPDSGECSQCGPCQQRRLREIEPMPQRIHYPHQSGSAQRLLYRTHGAATRIARLRRFGGSGVQGHADASRTAGSMDARMRISRCGRHRRE